VNDLTPHDTFFCAAFADPRHAAGLIRSAMARDPAYAALIPHIAWDQLRRVEATVVDAADRANVDVGLGSCEFFFCHDLLQIKNVPRDRFNVCTVLLIPPPRAAGGTQSQTRKIYLARAAMMASETLRGASA